MGLTTSTKVRASKMGFMESRTDMNATLDAAEFSEYSMGQPICKMSESSKPLFTRVRLVIRRALQSRKEQLIGMR